MEGPGPFGGLGWARCDDMVFMDDKSWRLKLSLSSPVS